MCASPGALPQPVCSSSVPGHMAHRHRVPREVAQVGHYTRAVSSGDTRGRESRSKPCPWLCWVRSHTGWVPFCNVCMQGTLQGLAQEKVLAVLHPRKVWEEGSLPLGVRSQEALAPTLSLRLRVRMCD